ncbi:MAG: hypothetical protein ACLFVP_05550 [Candidatus Bathyarchaeia archaeon]
MILFTTTGMFTCTLSYIVISWRRDVRKRRELEKLYDYLTHDNDEAGHNDSKHKLKTEKEER